MGSNLKRLAIVPAALWAVAIAATGTAQAADLLVEPVYEAPEVVTHAAGGWYIRGDISYDFNELGRPHYTSVWGGKVDFYSSSIDDSYDFQLGVGYQANENFRFDLTGEYVMETDFNGRTYGYCNQAAEDAGELNCASEETSSFTAFKLMANAYVDLGNISGFTPYVGAGIGGAYVSWNNLNSVNTCTQFNNGVVCPDLTEGFTGTDASSSIALSQKGVEAWRFAWALHAGFSYDLTHNTKLDLGYTYSHIESGDMFEWATGNHTQGFDKGIESHVVKAGLRYQIW